MAVNRYLVLGVARDATPRDIRRAYLRLAKALHPDRAGDSGTRSFQELQEAYATLSDPESRRAHDRLIDEERAAERADHLRAAGGFADPLSVLHAEARYKPSEDAIRDRFLRSATRISSEGELAERLNVEVILSAGEAARGVMLPLDVPVLLRCPSCGGSGRDWTSPCLYCDEEGMIEQTGRVRLHIPPFVRSGSVFDIPLDRLGVHDICLRVRVRVDDRLPH